MTGLGQQAPICNFMKMINQYPIVGDNLKKDTETSFNNKRAGIPVSSKEHRWEIFDTICFIFRLGRFHSYRCL